MTSTRISKVTLKCGLFIGLLSGIALFFGSAASVFSEAKAYEVVKYRGKAGGLTIVLDYGDGYAHASHLKVTEAGKTTHFMLDESGEMQFVPKDKTRADTRIVLKMNMDEGAPAKVEGTYFSGGRTISFTLLRK